VGEAAKVGAWDGTDLIAFALNDEVRWWWLLLRLLWLRMLWLLLRGALQGDRGCMVCLLLLLWFWGARCSG
jgi:hypothetical protein